MKPVRATYFTDVLCVWAYLNQVRIAELQTEFGDQLEIDPRFCPVFGDVPGKLERVWSDRGGAVGYAAHVRGVLEQYPHASVHDDTWARVTPASSLPAHLVLCGVRDLAERGEVARTAYDASIWAVREAFFRDGRNIGEMPVLFEVLEAQGLSASRVEERIRGGQAFSVLARDDELIRKYDIKLSPSLILNEGRQRLNGNVGFRVMEANVRGLLRQPGHGEASWC